MNALKLGFDLRTGNPRASAWENRMLASYESIHGALSNANRAELYERLKPGGYLHTTFGPGGSDETDAKFVLLFNFTDDVTTRAWTKGGDDPRYDFDGTVITQEDLPNHVLGAGAGILTVSSADAWAGLTAVNMNLNPFTGNFPNVGAAGLTAMTFINLSATLFNVNYADLALATSLGLVLLNDTSTIDDVADLLPLESLTNLQLQGSAQLDVSSNFLDSGNAGLITCRMDDTLLDADAVDQVLADYVAVENDGGLNLAADYVINLGGTNAIPGAQGLTDKGVLEALDWAGGGGSITITVSS